MRNSLRWTVVASGFFLALAACTVEEGDPDATGGSGGSTGGTGGTGGTTATGGTGGGTGGATGGTGGATGGAAGQGGTAGQGGSPACSFEAACNTCIVDNCSTLWANCELDTEDGGDGICLEAAACLCTNLNTSGACVDLQPCAEGCDADFNDAFNTLSTCLLNSCTAECVPTP